MTNDTKHRPVHGPGIIAERRERLLIVGRRERHKDLPPRPPHRPGHVTLPPSRGATYYRFEGCLVVDGVRHPPREG